MPRLTQKEALQVAASGDFSKGGRMFRSYHQRQVMTAAAFNEVKTGRRRQQANAKKSRQDALGAMLLEIMERNPAITSDQLLAELRKRERGVVIESINDEEKTIEWINKDGRPRDTPFSGLKDRISRAQKILRSR